MRIRRSKTQSSWEYMRRNPIFNPADVMMIVGISAKTLSILIRQLKQAGVLLGLDKQNVPFEEKRFRVRNTSSVLCPVQSQSKYVKKRK